MCIKLLRSLSLCACKACGIAVIICAFFETTNAQTKCWSLKVRERCNWASKGEPDNWRKDDVDYTFDSFAECIKFAEQNYGAYAKGSWMEENCERWFESYCEFCNRSSGRTNPSQNSDRNTGGSKGNANKSTSGSSSTSERRNENSKSGKSRNASSDRSINGGVAQPEPSDAQEIGATVARATPGILGAIDRNNDERRRRNAAEHDFEGKPEGFNSYDDLANDEWVAAANEDSRSGSALPEKDKAQNSFKENLETAESVLGTASDVEEMRGNEEASEHFETAASLANNLKMALNVAGAIKNPDDLNARMEVIEDVLNNTAEYAGKASGSAFNSLAPPVNLWSNVYEKSLGRLQSMIGGGEPTNEGEVWAPIADWFGNSVGAGNVGHRAMDYQSEGQESWNHLKRNYGWIEGTKRKVWYWLLDDLKKGQQQ